METAKQFCERTDREEGEAWSNDYVELAVKMQEYAEYYHREMTKKENNGKEEDKDGTRWRR